MAVPSPRYLSDQRVLSKCRVRAWQDCGQGMACRGAHFALQTGIAAPHAARIQGNAARMADATPSALIFDLDGTLVDTAPDLAAAMNHVLALHGRRHVALERVRHMVGQGARVLMARGFAETGTPVDDGVLDALYDEFLSHYLSNIAVNSRPFPGLAPVLDGLARDGVAMAVCTNKPEAATLALLDALDLKRYFGAVVGGDTLPVNKPHPETAREALRRLDAPADGAIFVGDSETDVATARAAGLAVIGVSFGYTERPVSSFGPDAVIDAFAELPSAIATVLAGRLTRRGVAGARPA